MSAINLKLQLINRGEEGELLMIGRLDSSTADEAEDIMLKLVDRFDCITLNMSELKYISSSGLRILKKMYMKTVKEGKDLQVKKASPFVLETFQMTGFAGILKII